jgi:hypothetical protein
MGMHGALKSLCSACIWRCRLKLTIVAIQTPGICCSLLQSPNSRYVDTHANEECVGIIW